MKFFLVITSILILFSKNLYALNSLKKNSSAVLKANEIDGNRLNQELIAKGDVEISKGSTKLFADEVIYKKNQKFFYASGNVKIKELEVGYLKSSEASIKDDFTEGEFLNSKIFFNDGSYLLSKKIEKKSKSITNLESPTFSICPNQEIADNEDNAGKKRNFATITSSSTVIDRENGLLKSKNAVFRIYDVPLLYSPYIRITLASKKRQTGFLGVSYARNLNFGLGVKTPYFINISPTKDLTITPTYYIGNGQFILDNKFRHYTKFGRYTTDIELANNRIKSSSNIALIGESNKKLRWNIRGNGEFDFDKNLGANFLINTVSDRNYLRSYNFNFQNRYLPYTFSNVNFDYIKGRNYFGIKTLRIQELENKDTEKAAPFILPSLDSHIESEPFFFKEKFALTSNLTNIYRQEGMDYSRGTFIPEAKIPFNLNGNLFDFNAKVQGDFYSIKNGIQNSTTQTNYKATESNYKSESSFGWRLPIIKKTKNSTITLEPMVNFITSNYRKRNMLIPNEDSNNTELTVSNLFITDRISGFDRNEAGQRLNYGFKSSFFHTSGEYSLTIGQGLRLKNKDQDVIIRGFAKNNKSSFVGQTSYKARKYFSATYSFQLNEKSLRNDVNQLNTNFDYERFSFSTDYLLIRRNDLVEMRREQINFTSSVKINDRWKLKLFSNKDIKQNRILQKGLIIEHTGCCVYFDFLYAENNPSNLSKPQRSFSLNLSFKNL